MTDDDDCAYQREVAMHDAAWRGLSSRYSDMERREHDDEVYFGSNRLTEIDKMLTVIATLLVEIRDVLRARP